MRAVVLVGGFGTRLRPLTLRTPKQMLPIAGETMLERVIRHLGEAGVDRVVLSLGYRPDAFTSAFPDARCAGVDLLYAVEPEPLDTAGAIAFAARSAGFEETFLALNGDVLTELDLEGMLTAHRASDATATIALTPVDDPSQYGVVVADGSGTVSAFVEKPPRESAPSNWINAGTYVLEPSVLDLIPAGVPTSIERSVFPALVERGAVRAVSSDAYWVDAGTPATYLSANLDLIDGTRRESGVAVHPTAAIHSDAVVTHSVVGAGAVIEAGAKVVGSVVMDSCRLGVGVEVSGSVVGGGTVIGTRSSVTNGSVVGYDQALPDGHRLDGGVWPAEEEWS